MLALRHSLFGWLRRAGGNAHWSPSWLASSHLMASPPSDAGVQVTPASAGALSAVYRACSFISDSLCSTEFRVVQRTSDGGQQIVDDSEAAKALRNWSFDERERFVWNAALGGNGIAIARRKGKALSLESVVPRRVAVAADEAYKLFYIIESADCRGESEIVVARDVAHLKFRAIGHQASNDVFAVPPIVTCAESLGLILASRVFQAALWKNGSIPIGALCLAGKIKDEAMVTRIREQFAQHYTGQNTGRVAILEHGMEWKPIEPSVSPADADLVNLNRFGVEEVARLYGVPPSLLAQTHSASYSTAVEESRAAVLHCLRPWAVRLSDCLGRVLLTQQERDKGMRVDVSLDSLLVAPGKEMSEYLRELVNSGILSLNEARNVLGLADIPGGDVHRAPVNTTDIKNLPNIGIGTNKPAGETP